MPIFDKNGKLNFDGISKIYCVHTLVYQKAQQAIQDIVDSLRNACCTLALFPDRANGEVNNEIPISFNYNNFMKDTAYSDTSNWYAFYGSLSNVESDLVYSFTVADKTFTNIMGKTNTTNPVYSADKRIYTQATVKVDAPTVNLLRLGVQRNQGGYQQIVEVISNPVVGQEYKLKGIVTLPYDVADAYVHAYINVESSSVFAIGDKVTIKNDLIAVSIDDNPEVLDIESKLGRKLTDDELITMLEKIGHYDSATSIQSNSYALLGAYNEPFNNPMLDLMDKYKFSFNALDNYIDTGIVPNANTVLKIYGSFNTPSLRQFHGCRSSDNLATSSFAFGIIPSVAKLQWGEGWAYGTGIVITDESLHVLDGGIYNIDGVEYGDISTRTFNEGTETIYIGAVNENGVPKDYTDFTIYYAEIIHNGTSYLLRPDPDTKSFIDQYGTNYPIAGVMTDEQFERCGATLQGFAETVNSGYDYTIVSGGPNPKSYSLTNIVENPRILSTDKWSHYYGAKTAENGVYKVTDTEGTRTTNRIYSYDTVGRYIKGNRLYVRGKMRSSCSDLTVFKMGYKQAMGYWANTSINNPNSNQWYEFSHFDVINYDHPDAALQVAVVFDTATTFAIGDTLELTTPLMVDVDKESDLLALEAEIGRQLTKDECDRIIVWNEGTYSIDVSKFEMINYDGVDDVIKIIDSPSISPTDQEDFAIACVFETASEMETSYVFAKSDGIYDVQYALKLLADGRIFFIYGQSSIKVVTSTHEPNTLYSFYVRRINGRLKIDFNGVTTVDSADTVVMNNYPDFNLGAISNAQRTRGKLGRTAIFYNGANGLDEQKVDEEAAKIFSHYGL